MGVRVLTTKTCTQGGLSFDHILALPTQSLNMQTCGKFYHTAPGLLTVFCPPVLSTVFQSHLSDEILPRIKEATI